MTDDPLAGARLVDCPVFRDVRGSLVPLEHATDLPFEPARTFFVFDVPGVEVRGEHAHRECDQLLLAVHGTLVVGVHDGVDEVQVVLDSPSRALLVPAGIWASQHTFSPDAVLCVFASLPYDDADYIRDFDDYLTWVADGRPARDTSA